MNALANMLSLFLSPPESSVMPSSDEKCKELSENLPEPLPPAPMLPILNPSSILDSSGIPSEDSSSPNSDPLTLLYQQQGVSPNTQMHGDGHIFLNISPNSLATTIAQDPNENTTNTRKKIIGQTHDRSGKISFSEETYKAGTTFAQGNNPILNRTPSVQYYSSSSSKSISNGTERQHNSSNRSGNIAPGKSHEQHIEWLQHMNYLALKSHYRSAVQNQSRPNNHSHSNTCNMQPIQEDVPLSQPLGSSSLPAALKLSHPINTSGQYSGNHLQQRKKSTLAATVQAQAEENLKRLSIAMNFPRTGEHLSSRGSSQPLLPITIPQMLLKNQPPHFAYTTNSGKHGKQKNEENAEDKRARRLARNRESARQSRRRKKEQLLVMSDRVVKMWDNFELERRAQVNMMERTISSEKSRIVLILSNLLYSDNQLSIKQQTHFLLNNIACPDSAARLSVVEFQYRQFLSYMLPNFRRFLLWLSLQETSFFQDLKEEFQHRKPNGRLSSRQIGEDIVADRTSETEKLTANGSGNNNLPLTRNSSLYEIWPLFCLELAVGLDQEDRFLSIHMQAKDNYKEDISKLKSATTLVNNMKRLTTANITTIGNNYQRCFHGVLTPDQSIRYLTWINMKRARTECNKLLQLESIKQNSANLQQSSLNTLNDLCERLNKGLKINNDG